MLRYPTNSSGALWQAIVGRLTNFVPTVLSTDGNLVRVNYLDEQPLDNRTGEIGSTTNATSTRSYLDPLRSPGVINLWTRLLCTGHLNESLSSPQKDFCRSKSWTYFGQVD